MGRFLDWFHFVLVWSAALRLSGPAALLLGVGHSRSVTPDAKKAFLEAFRASWGALSTENGLSAPRSSSGWIFRASRGGFGEIPPAPENPSFMTIASRVHDNSGNLQGAENATSGPQSLLMGGPYNCHEEFALI